MLKYRLSKQSSTNSANTFSAFKYNNPFHKKMLMQDTADNHDYLKVFFVRGKISNFCKHSSTLKLEPNLKTKTKSHSMEPRLGLGFQNSTFILHL